ncbi:hypothetical protein CDAR_494031 [Caerostris darwini]|uniref:Uncharacterized protein n=1 Tax=Caerostris darwini TaxID=1538125 RepID=A0AAV4VT92_9ARAC|nr:hypothetical protein CDAR_494031 [Caerostris darwini]
MHCESSRKECSAKLVAVPLSQTPLQFEVLELLRGRTEKVFGTTKLHLISQNILFSSIRNALWEAQSIADEIAEMAKAVLNLHIHTKNRKT